MKAMVVGLIVAGAAVATVDTRLRLYRSHAVLREFKRLSGYPHGRPGYRIDHIAPLCLSPDLDVVGNLQWQPLAESKIKDRFEVALCRALKVQGYRLVKVVP